MRSLSLIDELTGLYNRRGFMTLAAQHLKLARRTQRDCLLIYADMDGLKQINDTLGHEAGSNALRQVGKVLSKVFRESDLIGRLGGDEYTVLMPDASDKNSEKIAARLQEGLDIQNSRREFPFVLSLSVGISKFEYTSTGTLEELIAAADHAMYENKRSKRFSNRGDESLHQTALISNV